jgi:hypothetical protein
MNVSPGACDGYRLRLSSHQTRLGGCGQLVGDLETIHERIVGIPYFCLAGPEKASGKYNRYYELTSVVYRACLEGDSRTARRARERTVPLDDPEARFFTGCLLAKMKEPEQALTFPSLALDNGYRCHYALLHDPWLDSMRTDGRFGELVNRATARAVFLDNGGDRLLRVDIPI